MRKRVNAQPEMTQVHRLFTRETHEVPAAVRDRDLVSEELLVRHDPVRVRDLEAGVVHPLAPVEANVDVGLL